MMYRRGDDEDDWEVEDRRHDASYDSENALRGQASVNVNKGTVEILGKTLHVGSSLAYVFDFFYEPLMAEVSKQGARHFRNLGYFVSKTILHNSDAVANRVADGTGALWRYGSLMGDVGAGAGKTVVSGYRQMKDISESLQPYFAANHKFHVGVGMIMSDTNPGVANIRRAVLDRFKNGMKKNVSALLIRSPTLMITMWDAKLQAIHAQKDRYDALIQNSEGEAKAAAEADLKRFNEDNSRIPEGGIFSRMAEIQRRPDYLRWKDYHLHGEFPDYLKEHPNVAMSFLGEFVDPSNLRNTFNQLFRAKSEAELRVNAGVFRSSPFISGLIKRFVGEKFNRRIDEDDIGQFAVMQIARKAQSLKQQHTEQDREEWSHDIRGFFIQHLRDSGIAEEPDHNKLSKISDELAEAITQRGLNPYALIDLICGEKLLKYSTGSFVFTSTHERAQVIDKEFAKYTREIDNKDFYKDIGVKPENLKKIYTGLSAQERAVLVMLVPPGVLEQQGINKSELARIRKENRSEFLMDTLSQALANIKDLTSDDLRKEYGIPEGPAKMLLSAAEDFVEAAQNSEREENNHLTKSRNEAGRAVLKAGVAAKNPGNFLHKLLSRGQEKNQAGNEDMVSEKSADDDEDDDRELSARPPRRKPMDHTRRREREREARSTGDETGLGR